MNSIIEAVVAHAAEHPDRICFADVRDSVTYEQAVRAVIHFARRIRKENIHRGDRVLIECTQDVRFCIANLAAQLAGAVTVPLEKRASEARVLEIKEDTGADVIIGMNLAAYSDHFISFADIDLDAPASELTEFTFPAKDELAEILFSTGTTGKSKGIVHTHGSVIAVAENVVYSVKMKDGGVELIPTPLSHSHGLRRHYANLLFGNSIVIADGVLMVKVIFTLMDRYHVTAMDMSPSALQVLEKLGKGRLAEYRDQLDYIQIGTAPLSEQAKETLREQLPNTHLYNFYGTTEGGCSCIMDFSVERNRPACIGKPTVNAHFIIVDEHRQPLKNTSPEHTGYLAYSGSMNMLGYWRQPELTASVMTDGIIYSNDVGYIDPDGYIYMLGRDDDVINYSGIKISPEEIESAVSLCDGVVDCACVPQPDPLTGQAPHLFVVMEAGKTMDKSALLEQLKKSVDPNKMPKVIEQIDAIPRTFNGKILRRELRARIK